jgi:hypothetical protein
MTKYARLMAPATARNREHITKVLRRHLPSHGLVFEVASGTGEHIIHFAGELSADLTFQPSDPDAAARTSVDAWVESTGVRNVVPAMALDASADPWPIQWADYLHQHDPYRAMGSDDWPGARCGASAAGLRSNKTFDRGLRMQNPKWGVPY